MKASTFISYFVGKVVVVVAEEGVAAGEEEAARWVVVGVAVAQDVATPALSFMYVEC
jgi:hypothetical protein